MFAKIVARISRILPDKSIEKSKEEWNRLAAENHRYYIVSKEGRDIDNVQFKQSGEETYGQIVSNDKLLLDTIGPFDDKKVLDIGCGAGRLLEFFAKDFHTADGVDISEKMVEEGRKRLAHLSNVSLTATDGMHYPFADDTFDLVFSYIVFQHMPSEEVIKENFKEIRRVLKHSGMAKIQIRGGHLARKGTWFYGPTFNTERAEAMVKEAGLNVVQMGDDSVKRFWLWLKK